MALRALARCTHGSLENEFGNLTAAEQKQLVLALNKIIHLLSSQGDQSVSPHVNQWYLMTPGTLVTFLAVQPLPDLYRSLQYLSDHSKEGLLLRRILFFSLFRLLRRQGHHDDRGFMYGRRKRIIGEIQQAGHDVDERSAGELLTRYAENGLAYSQWVDDLGGTVESLLALPTDMHEDRFRKPTDRSALLQYLTAIGVPQQALMLRKSNLSVLQAVQQSSQLQKELMLGVPLRIPDDYPVKYPLGQDHLLWIFAIERHRPT